MRQFSIDDPIVRVEAGEEFQIDASAVPTGGFRWLSMSDDPSVEQTGEEFDTRSSRMGGSTVQHLRFRANASGEFALRLRYQQAGSDSPREERTVLVRVSGD